MSADELVEQAIAAVNRGALDEAEGLCGQALEISENARAYFVRGFVAQSRRRYEQAVTDAGRAAALGYESWQNFLTLGKAHTALGQIPQAYEALLQAARRNARSADLANRLLRIALMHRGVEHAGQIYRELFAAQQVREIDDAWLAMALEAGLDVEIPPYARAARQDTALHWAERSGIDVLRLGEPEAIPVQALGQDQIEYVRGNPPYAVDLPDVQVFAYSHAVLTADGFALNEAGGHPEYGRFVDHRSDAAVIGHTADTLYLRTDAFRMEDLDEAVWLAGPASNEFGHWLGEFAPRLEFLEQHPAFAGRPIIIDEGMPASHLELLSMICPNRLITLPRGHGLRVKRLLYAPTPTFFLIHLLPNHGLPEHVACIASVRSYRFLKARVEQALGVTPQTGAKYYLTRAGRAARKVRNEAEVRSFLEAHGYQTVTTETLTFADQVRLFQSASAIVAPNGSAMQNFIYARPDTKLFVLTQANVHNLAAFNGQARAMGFAPVFIPGQAVRGSNWKHADYDVPLEALAPAVA